MLARYPQKVRAVFQSLKQLLQKTDQKGMIFIRLPLTVFNLLLFVIVALRVYSSRVANMAKSKVRIIKRPDKAIREIEKIAKNLSGPDSVKVGLPKGSNDYPDGTSVIMVGAVHEFGSPARNIPQRSFLRATVQEKRKDYKKLFQKLGRAVLFGDMVSQKALRILGLQVQSDVRQKITDIQDPPLKSREGNPLVDTGHLRQTITFQVGD